MRDSNQEAAGDSSRALPASGAEPAREDVPTDPWPTAPPPAPGAPGESADTELPAGPPQRDERGLLFWLVAVALALPLSMFFGQVELGLLTAIGGMFAVAHAAERDQRWTTLHLILGWIPPAGAAAMFVLMAVWFAKPETFTDTTLATSDRMAGAALSLAGVVVSLALFARPFADAIARVAFRSPHPGSVDRLGARLVVISFLVAPAGWYFVKALMAGSQLDQLAIGTGSFAGSLAGFTLLTLGAAGFPVRRGWRATRERLGLRRMTWGDVALVAGGLLALVLLNAGMEWVARTWFPGMFQRDQAMNELIAGRLTRAGMLMLGVSAGVGEEIAMRGALQPRLGLLPTSLLFAALHVQYSPLGMATIALIGVLLGVIRQRGGTTSAIVVHVLYDILAAAGAQSG